MRRGARRKARMTMINVRTDKPYTEYDYLKERISKIPVNDHIYRDDVKKSIRDAEIDAEITKLQSSALRREYDAQQAPQEKILKVTFEKVKK